ncbi:MAG: M15 family metallopeptidase [Oscillospiraceae bacterium]|nr:M15 family metallopeptidase [Oscillospiraceae bacterium]
MAKKKISPEMEKRIRKEKMRRKAERKRKFKRAMDIFAAVLLFGGFCAAVGYPVATGMISIDSMTGKEAIGEVKTTDESSETETEPVTEAATKSYETITVKNEKIYKGDLILVNADYPFKDSNDADIVTLYNEKTDSYSVSGMEIGLQKNAVEPLNDMLDAFYEETGHSDILIIAGFRTLEQQQALYDEDLERTGLDTSTLVALPGHSEHESGYAMDFSLFFDDGTAGDYDGTGDYEWIDEHCADYGFILRYPADKTEITGIQHESWHYRYIGRPHAYYIMQSGICYEEYIEELKEHDVENPLEIVDSDGKAYQVYYVPAEMDRTVTYVPLVSDKPYTISGNNADGFIVTIDLEETRELVSYTKPASEITGITTDEYGNVVATEFTGIATDEYGNVISSSETKTETVRAVG